MKVAVYKISSTGIATGLFVLKDRRTSTIPVVMDKAGNLYGSTMNGGPPHLGTIFKLTKQK